MLTVLKGVVFGLLQCRVQSFPTSIIEISKVAASPLFRRLKWPTVVLAQNHFASAGILRLWKVRYDFALCDPYEVPFFGFSLICLFEKSRIALLATPYGTTTGELSKNCEIMTMSAGVHSSR